MMKLETVLHVITNLVGKEISNSFQLEQIEKANQLDVFELESVNHKLIIRGSSGVAITFGFNWYLKYYCHVHHSWCGNQLNMPTPLPAIPHKIRQVSPYPYKYYLNYCTHSYSMAFWDWERWQKEIDWMALNGVNLVLNIVGQEEVYRRFLLKLGYSEDEALLWSCGPAYFGWQWMQNLSGWAGPLPHKWYEDRVTLGRKINQRMLDLGIQPVLQAYTGMVPNDFIEKFPDAQVIEQGQWLQFQRTDVLAPTDPMFAQVADLFYQEQRNLFGNVGHYAGDIFHEGGNAGDLDITQVGQNIQNAMTKSNENAVWVIQAWGHNPKKELLENLNKDQVLTLDLWAEVYPKWNETQAFYGTTWVWSMLHNFGGNIGLYGNLNAIAEIPNVLHHEHKGNLIGVGMAPEGIETNPIVYDLMTEMGWRKEVPDIDDWISGYIRRRYNTEHEDIKKAWTLLKNTVYNCSIVQEGTVESLICARPSEKVTSVSIAGPTEGLYYSHEDLEKACQLIFKHYHTLKHSDAYLYDLVDITRQVLANLSRDYYDTFMDAYNKKDIATYQQWSYKFLQLIEDQDRLLHTRKEFLLGRWLEDAKALGRRYHAESLFEFNARALITIWGPESEMKKNLLADYSHREWSGLLIDFYYPRWKMYIESLEKALEENSKPIDINWYLFESNWASKRNIFEIEPKGNIYEIIHEVINKYFNV